MDHFCHLREDKEDANNNILRQKLRE